jgi:poly(hydroxyalkanoate) granule-associated protein
MAKKKTLKKSASTEKKTGNLAESLVGSANEIWLAGLGAFAKAQSEGKKIYDKLIDEGKDFEKLFKSVPQKAVSDVKSTVSSTVSSAKKRASESWDKLEDVFEKRVEKSLKSLGVPTGDELGELVKRIETLTKEVSKLVKDSGKSAADDIKKAGASIAQNAADTAKEVKKIKMRSSFMSNGRLKGQLQDILFQHGLAKQIALTIIKAQ